MVANGNHFSRSSIFVSKNRSLSRKYLCTDCSSVVGISTVLEKISKIMPFWKCAYQLIANNSNTPCLKGERIGTLVLPEVWGLLTLWPRCHSLLFEALHERFLFSDCGFLSPIIGFSNCQQNDFYFCRLATNSLICSIIFCSRSSITSNSFRPIQYQKLTVAWWTGHETMYGLRVRAHF